MGKSRRRFINFADFQKRDRKDKRLDNRQTRHRNRRMSQWHEDELIDVEMLPADEEEEEYDID